MSGAVETVLKACEVAEVDGAAGVEVGVTAAGRDVTVGTGEALLQARVIGKVGVGVSVETPSRSGERGCVNGRYSASLSVDPVVSGRPTLSSGTIGCRRNPVRGLALHGGWFAAPGLLAHPQPLSPLSVLVNMRRTHTAAAAATPIAMTS